MPTISMLPGLLFILHKKGIPTDEQQLRKKQIKTYALLPFPDRPDVICEKLANSKITMLESPLDDPLLTEAATSNQLEIIQIYFAFEDDNDETLAVGFHHQDTRNIVKLVLQGWRFRKDPKEAFFNPAYILDDDRITGIIKKLASFYPDIRYRGQICGTILHFAVQGNDKSLVRYLLRKGARVDARTIDNWTPLHVAALYGTEPILMILLRNGADIHATIAGSEYDGATPLHVAVQRRDLMDWRPRHHVIKCLIQQGASVDAHCARGSVLQLACSETLSCILEYHPNVNGTTSIQEALRTALRDAHAECTSVQNCGIVFINFKASLLYDKGVRLVPEDAKSTELLLGAVQTPELMKDLLKWGAGFYFNLYPKLAKETKDVLANLLERAISRGRMDSAKFLLQMEDSDSTELHDLALKRTILVLNDGCARDILKSIGLRLNSTFYADLPAVLEGIDYPETRSFFENVFKEHILLLNALGLTCNEKFFQGVLPMWVQEALKSPKLNDYKTQVAEMKTKKIVDLKISFHDLLNISSRQVVSFLRNKSAVETLQGKKFARKFPDYFDIFKWRFDKAIFRRDLLDQGMKMFNFLYKKSPMKDLSFELKENILDFLTNQDLYVFVNVCKLVE